MKSFFPERRRLNLIPWEVDPAYIRKQRGSQPRCFKLLAGRPLGPTQVFFKCPQKKPMWHYLNGIRQKSRSHTYNLSTFGFCPHEEQDVSVGWLLSLCLQLLLNIHSQHCVCVCVCVCVCNFVGGTLAPHLLGGALPLDPHFQAVLLWLIWRQGLSVCPGQPGPWSFYFKLPIIAGMTCVCHHTQLFSVVMGFNKLFFCAHVLAWNWDLPDLSLPSS
jgi:hypothetical protein